MDACTQTRNHNTNVFETQCRKLMRVRTQGSTFQTCLKHRVETEACIQQGTTIHMCLNTGCRLMLVRQPVITIQRL